MPLSGRLVLITGAGGAAGAAAVSAASEAGAQLWLVDRHQDRLDGLAATHPETVVRTTVVDLANEAEVRALTRPLADGSPGVDVVWHLVGGWRGGKPLDEAPASDWTDLYPSLVQTTVAMTRAFAAPLIASAHGRFVIVSSPQAQHPTTTNAAYGGAKAATEAAALSLAHHFSSSGSSATSNVVVVPAIVTSQMREAHPDRPWRIHVDADAIAQALVFVSSDAAAKMNGQRLCLFDGSAS